MNNIKVCVLPLDIAWADVDENLYAAGRLLKSVDKDTDIVVLPELFSTGFLSTSDLLREHAENPDNSPTLDQIRRWAAKYNFAIAGSMLVATDENTYYNRAFFVEPSGETTFYDKKHLFGLGGEAEKFTAGTARRPVIRFRGWNITMAVCYDLRFPVWLRNVDNEYDLMLIPANWPQKRAYAWQQLLIARAIENQAYVVGCNRSGRDDAGDYNGLSYIFNYFGKPIHAESKEIPEALYAVFDRERLADYRGKFPVADDADRFFFSTEGN